MVAKHQQRAGSGQEPDWRALERSIGVKFKDRRLLRQAAVHRSYLNEQEEPELESYERLEYLGDAFLGWVVADELYRRYPDFNEGALTRGRASLVQGKTLREIADSIDLGSYLYMGQGEEAHGGRQRQSNLAAALEALLGAVLMDRGEKAARKLVLRWMETRLRGLKGAGAALDKKSALQELLQGQGMPLPRYELVKEAGPAHERQFTVRVLIDGKPMGEGTGRRKGDAEQLAAAEAMAALGA